MDSVEVVYTEGAARVLRGMGEEMQDGFRKHVEKFATEIVWGDPSIMENLGKSGQGNWGGGCTFRALPAFDHGLKLVIITAMDRH
ncbi:hypothetical protein [Streptomyces mirabilis]|uniref:hypothetical protein n=1 Tax=Streptomyces mirabilis TaxID=68239 RepID=UPI0036AF935C